MVFIAIITVLDIITTYLKLHNLKNNYLTFYRHYVTTAIYELHNTMIQINNSINTNYKFL